MTRDRCPECSSLDRHRPNNLYAADGVTTVGICAHRWHEQRPRDGRDGRS